MKNFLVERGNKDLRWNLKMVIRSRYRLLKLLVISSLLTWAVYIVISKVQDPSDFNHIIHPVRLNLTSLNPNLEISEEDKVESDTFYQAHLLPVLENDYQEQIVDKRRASFISNSRKLSSFATTNANFFWTYFPSINSWCPFSIERIGGILWNWKWRGEGGKWLCGLNLYESPSAHFSSEEEYRHQQLEHHRHQHQSPIHRPCIVYSYGIEKDTSFESAFLSRVKNCHVYMFDPSIDGTSSSVQSLLHQYPNRSTFHRIGLSYENIQLTPTEKYRTLKTEMDLHGHKFIDILKIDIEGSEFEVFRHIIDKEFRLQQSLPFGQLQLEIHLPNLGPERIRLYYQFQEWYEKLENAGLRAFHSEPNPMSASEPNDHVKYYEYSFINVKSNHFILQNYTLPFTK